MFFPQVSKSYKIGKELWDILCTNCFHNYIYSYDVTQIELFSNKKKLSIHESFVGWMIF